MAHEMTWPRGSGPSWVTSAAYGVVVAMSTEDEAWTMPPATPSSITIRFTPNAMSDVQEQTLYWVGQDGTQLGQVQAPNDAVVTYHPPAGTASLGIGIKARSNPSPVFDIPFPYEGGREVSFTVSTTPTVQVGVGGPYITGVTMTGSFPGVHYFADPVDHTEVYAWTSFPTEQGLSTWRQELGAIGLWGTNSNHSGTVGVGLPQDFGFGIGGYQRDIGAWQRKYVWFTAMIPAEDPAEWSKKHPDGSSVPMVEVGLPGYVMLQIIQPTSVSLFGMRYHNEPAGNKALPPAENNTSNNLSGQSGPARAFFTGRRAP